MKNLAIIFFLLLFFVSAQAPFSQYNFQGNFEDTMGNSQPLEEFNTATSGFDSEGWWWTADSNPGGGLHLTIPMTNPQVYSIGVRFKFSEVSPSYRKILSFLAESSDNGLYFFEGKLNIYPFGSGPNTFLANTYYDFVFTRDSADNVKFYIVDNTKGKRAVYLELENADATDTTVPNSLGGGLYQFLWFRDDISTNTEWTTQGAVRIIKFWDRTLSASEIANAMDPIFIAPEIDIKGNLISIPNGKTTPSLEDSTDFGQVVVNTTQENSFLIENLGNTNLNLTGTPSISITGTHAENFFVTVQPNTPIVSGTSSNFAIAFSCSAEGTYQATVSIANDDFNENPYTFAIQATGIATQPVGKRKDNDYRCGATGFEALFFLLIAAWMKRKK